MTDDKIEFAAYIQAALACICARLRITHEELEAAMHEAQAAMSAADAPADGEPLA